MTLFTSTTHRFVSAVVALAVAAVMAVPAVGGAVEPEELEQFEQHVEKASSHIDAEDYEEGIEELEQAREIIDHPRVSETIADAYKDWGRCSLAEGEYADLMERDDVDAERLEQVEESAKRLEEECVELAVLHIRCVPEAASLTVDDQQKSCPFEGDVPVGELEVRADAEDHEPVVETVDVEANDRNEHAVELQPTPTVDWIGIGSWSAIGVGAGLLATGGLNDYWSGRRATRIADADRRGAQERVEYLEDRARTARITTVSLYLGGAVLVAAGTAAQFVDVEEVLFADDEVPGVSLRFGPSKLTATFRW